MQPFEFRAELFDHRNAALEALAEHGYQWLSDFGSVDMLHDLFGLEVCGIRAEADARAIRRLLEGLFPGWRHRRLFHKDYGREAGWKVVITRDPERFEDDWQHAG
jgi:hypothetical protein